MSLSRASSEDLGWTCVRLLADVSISSLCMACLRERLVCWCGYVLCVFCHLSGVLSLIFLDC